MVGGRAGLPLSPAIKEVRGTSNSEQHEGVPNTANGATWCLAGRHLRFFAVYGRLSCEYRMFFGVRGALHLVDGRGERQIIGRGLWA